MAEFRLGDILELQDGDYVVEGLQGGSVRLRNATTQVMQVLHVTALVQLLTVPPLLAADRPGPRDLERLSPKERSEVEDLARHVEDVIYGSTAEHRDSAYGPATTTLAARVAAKERELALQGRKTSQRTIKRWVAAYRRAGPSGLLDGRKSRITAPLGRLDPRVRDALVTVISRATDRSTKAIKNLLVEVRAEVLRCHPDEQVEIPSDRTLRRHFEVLTKGKYTSGNAANRRSAANSPKRMFSPRPAIAPGHEVQVDSSPFDVMVIDEVGKPLRAKLTIMLDKATQSIIATGINVDGPKGVGLAFMLAQCLTPRPARPLAGRLATEPELNQMPWARHLTGDQLEKADATRTFIKPQRIMTDNGKEYLSDTFRSACERFGIDITHSAIHTPTDKPNVERAFHTIKTKFVEHLPGATGGSVDRRGSSPEDDDLLDIFTFAELFDRWVAVVWQNMTHEALRDPMYPTTIHSPNSMYMAMFDMTGFVPVPIHPDDYIALLPTIERSIQTKGIQVFYRRYDSIHLNPYRLQPSNRSDTNGGWVVHYNPHNPAAVWVRDPETDEWIECAWMNKDDFQRPFSASIRRQARQITEAQGVLGDPESTEKTVDMIGQTRTAQARHQRAESNRRTEQELAAQAGKLIPSPTTTLTEVPEADDGDDFEDYEVFDPRKGVK